MKDNDFFQREQIIQQNRLLGKRQINQIRSEVDAALQPAAELQIMCLFLKRVKQRKEEVATLLLLSFVLHV